MLPEHEVFIGSEDLTLNCVLLLIKLKEAFASNYSLIGNVFTRVGYFKRMTGVLDLIIEILHCLYW